MKMRAFAVLALLLPGLAGCAGLMSEPEPPEVRLNTLALDEVGLFEQRYRVGLRLINPNDFRLRVSELRFDLDVNGHAVADGITADGINLPALGEGDVQILVRSSTIALVAMLQEWSGGARDTVDYRIDGSLRLHGWGLRVPFERSGSVRLTAR